jgi:hypothetical protein
MPSEESDSGMLTLDKLFLVDWRAPPVILPDDEAFALAGCSFGEYETADKRSD